MTPIGPRTNPPFRRIPWDVTPQDLKAARLKLGISLRYVSDHLGPAAVILQAIEENRLTATPALLEAWTEVLLSAPRRGSLDRFADRALELCVCAIILGLMAVVAGLLLMPGGR